MRSCRTSALWANEFPLRRRLVDEHGDVDAVLQIERLS